MWMRNVLAVAVIGLTSCFAANAVEYDYESDKSFKKTENLGKKISAKMKMNAQNIMAKRQARTLTQEDESTQIAQEWIEWDFPLSGSQRVYIQGAANATHEAFDGAHLLTWEEEKQAYAVAAIPGSEELVESIEEIVRGLDCPECIEDLGMELKVTETPQGRSFDLRINVDQEEYNDEEGELDIHLLINPQGNIVAAMSFVPEENESRFPELISSISFVTCEK